MTSYAELDWRGRRVRIEYAFIAPERQDAPLIVFLHEGLGSLAMWRDYPQTLCDAAGARGLVYSRPGYGRSTPRAADEAWGPDFMHRQAHEVLPALLTELGVDVNGEVRREKVWLFGHSDGGSIALLHAARFPESVAGCIVCAPHIFVEDISIESIAKAKAAYENTDLRQRLSKYHDDPDSAFRGWNDIWLHPSFRNWNIEEELNRITCPLLAVQGLDDEYGSLAQIRGIAQRAPQTELLELADCGHSAHRDQPGPLTRKAADFIRRHS